MTRPWETDLVGRTSAELRDAYLKWRFEPLAHAWARQATTGRSLTVAFRQGCGDEAADAVEEVFAESELPVPPWLALPGAFPQSGSLGWDPRRVGHDGPDENSTLIVAFASCCFEGAGPPGSYVYSPPAPWAIARRRDDGTVGVEVVGRVLRPWWEDRWDVGFHRTDDSPGQRPPPPDGIEIL